MEKVVSSIREIKNVRQNSGTLVVSPRSTPCLYKAKRRKSAFKRSFTYRTRPQTDWLDVLTIMLGLCILAYLLLCAVVNVYVLDSIVGL